MARHNRKWDGARTALGAIPGAEVDEVDQSKNRTFCCGAGGGCFWKEEHEGTRINQKRFDQLNEAKPEAIAVGCPFCMTMLEDAVKSRSLEETDARARPRRDRRRIHRRSRRSDGGRDTVFARGA